MTPEEKAKELGVRLIPAHPKIPSVSNKSPADREFEAYVKSMNEVVAVCGGCGKEMRRMDIKSPCGIDVCPFGYLTNHVL